jgi:hypothetical protein
MLIANIYLEKSVLKHVCDDFLKLSLGTVPSVFNANNRRKIVRQSQRIL